MASVTYGSLTVPVSPDMRGFAAKVTSGAESAGNDAGEKISKGIGSRLGASAAKVGKGVATALGTGVLAVTAFGAESIKAAAQVDKMRTNLDALAKANGLTSARVQGSVEALHKQGLTTEAAQQVTADFVKEHINLQSALKLSTVAQNAAALSGKSTSVVMEGITQAVSTGNTRVLRQAGLVVNSSMAFKEYAAQIGTTASKLTEAQRQQAIVNAVMERGKSISGAYAASLNSPARVLASFPRIAHDIQESLGEQLLKGVGPLIVSAGRLARGLRDALAPGGALAPVLRTVGTIAQQMVAPFTQIINLAAKWVNTLQPGTLAPVLAQVTKFAPAFASLATALGAFAGGQYLSKIPILGEMFSGLTGPVGAVVTGLVTLAATSPQARAALGQLATGLMTGLQPIMKALVPIIGQLGTDLGVVLGAALRALLPLVPPLVSVLQATLAVLLPLVPVITWLANQLARLAPIIVPLVAAYYAWVAVQWLLTAAMDASPIGLWTIAIVALVAAVAFAIAHMNQLEAVVLAVWRAILGVVMPIVTGLAAVIVGTFRAIQSAVGSVLSWIAQHWQALLLGLLVAATGPLGALVLLVVKNWAAIRNATSAALTWIQQTAANTWRAVASTASQLWANIAGVISRAWAGIVNGARTAGGAVINGLRSGMAAAISGIGSWIKSNIVDPIVNNVKKFFGIHSPSTVMAGIGTNLVKGLFVGMVPGIGGIGNLIGSVFGGFPGALAGLIHHGLIGLAGLPGKALNALMGLFGGGGDAGKLAATAGGFNGHRYVWGGPANAQAGFDCSSFVNMLTGMLHLPNPQPGWSAPSSQHGPVTGTWLGFSRMQRVAQQDMRMNDLYVSNTHMGVVTGPGRGFAARSTATGTGPQGVGGGYSILRFPGGGVAKLPSWLAGIAGSIMGKIGGFFSGLFGGGGSPGGQPVPGGVARWKGVVDQVLSMFGRPDLEAVILAQMMTESGGNPNAINNWDSNAAIGQNSRGLMQVIPATFAAYAGPFASRGIFDPLANVYAAVAYALSRYGSRIASVLGHGHGYAAGGVISEPVFGFGLHSGDAYQLGEAGPELVSPLTGPAASMGGGRVIVNVYPQRGQSEVAIAAAVSRQLAWAQAGGAA